MRGVLQNRMDLDIVTTAQGRTCTLIGKECCMYVPDPEANITDLMSHMQKTITQIEKLFFVDSLAMWLNLLPGKRGDKNVVVCAIHYLRTIVILLLSVLLLGVMSTVSPIFCSAWFLQTQLFLKRFGEHCRRGGHVKL